MIFQDFICHAPALAPAPTLFRKPETTYKLSNPLRQYFFTSIDFFFYLSVILKKVFIRRYIVVFCRTNGDAATVPPKQPEEKETDEFDGLELPTEKLSHPTANRAKPPQRRPPSGLPIAAQVCPH